MRFCATRLTLARKPVLVISISTRNAVRAPSVKMTAHPNNMNRAVAEFAALSTPTNKTRVAAQVAAPASDPIAAAMSRTIDRMRR
jgi:hypothetical protein